MIKNSNKNDNNIMITISKVFFIKKNFTFNYVFSITILLLQYRKT